MNDLVERLRAYLSLQPDSEGRTFHAMHPETLINEAVDALSRIEAERDNAVEAATAARQNFHTMQGAANQLRIRAEKDEAERDKLREALLPFARFSVNTDENGWLSNIHREAISTWFGPTAFREADAALNSEQSEANP